MRSSKVHLLGTISFYIGGSLITFLELFFVCTNWHRRQRIDFEQSREKADKRLVNDS